MGQARREQPQTRDGRTVLLWDADQRDGVFRARGNAQAAGMTGIRIQCEGLPPAMSETLEFAAQAQPLSQRWRDGSHREDIVGTNRHTLHLAFATIAVDDWPDLAGRLVAICILGMHCCDSLWFDGLRGLKSAGDGAGRLN